MDEQPPDFLLRHLPSANASTSRPWITVTWAQSLDYKIAGPGGSRVTLSGPESMKMTHWYVSSPAPLHLASIGGGGGGDADWRMRTMHDAILVGITTIVMDDPRLQIQLVPQDDSTLLPPQPLILDPTLRFPLNARILGEWTSSKDNPSKKVVKQPWVICGDSVPSGRIQKAEAAGVRVIAVPLHNGRISPSDMPSILSRLGLRTVMIEGGSRILSSFLHAPPRADGSPLVDGVVVTVAPMFIGDGIPVVPPEESDSMPVLETLHTETMGKDAVMVCSIRPPQ